jgi:hypothetical protein
MREDKLDPIFKIAADFLRQDRSAFSVEQQVNWEMELKRTAMVLLDKMDFCAWNRHEANLDVAVDLARTLSEIHLAEPLARRIAADMAIHANPGSEREKEMLGLFDSLSAYSPDDQQRVSVARDFVQALSDVHTYHNKGTSDQAHVKVPGPNDHGFNLRAVAMAKLFEGALLDDPENFIEACAVIAEGSPSDSVERLAAVVGLLKYPQYTDDLEGAVAEEYIARWAPIGSQMRDEAEETLKVDAAFPLSELFARARAQKEKK